MFNGDLILLAHKYSILKVAIITDRKKKFTSNFVPPHKIVKYRIRQRGCSLNHSARILPAVHQGIMIWVDEIEIEKK